MKTITFSLLLALIISITSCEKKAESSYESKQDIAADSSWSAMSSEAAKKEVDTSRSFVRTADLKFKVKDAKASCIAIENLIISNGGFVTYSHLRSENIRSRKVKISEDSSLKITQYYLVNDLEFRIPVEKLHSTLVSIGQNANFIDYRTIEAKEKTWELLKNTKHQRRLQNHNNRLSSKIKNQKDKILETSEALDQLLYNEEEVDNTELSQKILADEINYSTVKINLYEDDQLLKELEANENYYSEFKPGFIKEASYNIKEGLEIAEILLLFLLRILPIILLITTIILIIVLLKNKIKNRFKL